MSNEQTKAIDPLWVKHELARVNAKRFPVEAHHAMDQALSYIEQLEVRIAERDHIIAELNRALDEARHDR